MQEFAKEFDFTMRQTSEDDGMIKDKNDEVDVDSHIDDDMEVDGDDNQWMEDCLEIVEEPNSVQKIKYDEDGEDDEEDDNDGDGDTTRNDYNNSSIGSASSDSSDSSSSSENGYGDDDEDNGSDSEDSGLDPELDELATIMKTSLNPENGISNWN